MLAKGEAENCHARSVVGSHLCFEFRVSGRGILGWNEVRWIVERYCTQVVYGSDAGVKWIVVQNRELRLVPAANESVRARLELALGCKVWGALDADPRK